MRRLVLCFSLFAMGCSGEVTLVEAPKVTVTNESVKELLKGVSQSGVVGSGAEQIQMGIEAANKPELKKDLDELIKADSEGQSAKVKQIAEKLLKSL